MFCTNCGFKLEDGDVFCPNCGQRIEVEESFAESEMFYDDPQPQGMYQSEPPFQKQGGSDAEDTITNYIIAAAGGIGLSWLAVAALRVVNIVLLVLSNIFYVIPPLHSIVDFLDRLVNYLRLGLIWALIIIPIVALTRNKTMLRLDQKSNIPSVIFRNTTQLSWVIQSGGGKRLKSYIHS